MSTQPVVIEKLIEQAANLSSEDKKALAERLLAEVAEEEQHKTQNMSEEEQRRLQRIKNQAALDLMKKLVEDNSGYEEENAELIDEAIAATIRK